MCFCRSSPSPVLSLAPQFLLSEIRISDLTWTAKGTLTSVTLQWLSHFPKVQLHATFTCSPLKGLQWPGKQMMLNTDMCLVWSNDKDGKVDMKRGCIFDWNHKTLKTMKPQTSLRTFENIWTTLEHFLVDEEWWEAGACSKGLFVLVLSVGGLWPQLRSQPMSHDFDPLYCIFFQQFVAHSEWIWLYA